MARNFKGNMNNDSDKYNEFDENEFSKLLDEMTDEEIEKAVDAAIANGNEELKQLKLQNDMEIFNDVLNQTNGDEYSKAILRGLAKKNLEKQASFVGTKRNDEKYQKYIRMEGALRFFAKASGIDESTLFISAPAQNKRHAMLHVDIPDMFEATSKNRVFLSELIRLADETTFAVAANLDGTPVENPEMGLTFLIRDIWE